MQGIFIKESNEHVDSKTGLNLLAELDNADVMLQSIDKDALIWISPAENKELVEFFYIIKGELTLENDTERIKLHDNDSFTVAGLNKEILLKSNTELKILYITSHPLYTYIENYSCDLSELLSKISEKDRYTKEHCIRVKDYCMKIAKLMNCGSASMDDISIASRFHDVGKCFIPDDILTKKGKLDNDEWKYIVKHPINTRRLLETKFGKHIANIALMHHERLDGSGYPYGLSGDEIPIESRIIAVADCFDAMTSSRPYKDKKTPEQAIKELMSLPHRLDINVSRALYKLIDSKQI